MFIRAIIAAFVAAFAVGGPIKFGIHASGVLDNLEASTQAYVLMIPILVGAVVYIVTLTCCMHGIVPLPGSWIRRWKILRAISKQKIQDTPQEDKSQS